MLVSTYYKTEKGKRLDTRMIDWTHRQIDKKLNNSNNKRVISYMIESNGGKTTTFPTYKDFHVLTRTDIPTSSRECWILMDPNQTISDKPVTKPLDTKNNRMIAKLLSSTFFTATELKFMLRERNLPVTGIKDVLTQRLLKYLTR